ncbi:MAG: hypothetical protein C4318_07660 [Acidimicrobiia bacterium]
MIDTEMQRKPSKDGPTSDTYKHYGPTAIVTVANVITFGRAASLPLLFYLILEGRYSSGAAWASFGLWTLLGISDSLDGIAARRLGPTTSGAYLDPLADKLQVIGALGILLLERRLSWIPVSLIVTREVAVSVLRSMAARRGVSIPATPFGKAKTVTQMTAVGLFLFPPLASRPGPATIAMWLAVGFTLASGLDYAWRGIHVLSKRPVAESPPPDSGSLEDVLEPVIQALLDREARRGGDVDDAYLATTAKKDHQEEAATVLNLRARKQKGPEGKS